MRYHLRENLIATRVFQVDERARDVILGQFAVEKYEERYNGLRNVTGIHELGRSGGGRGRAGGRGRCAGEAAAGAEGPDAHNS